MITVNRKNMLDNLKLHAAALKVQDKDTRFFDDYVTISIGGGILTIETDRNCYLETRTACVDTQGLERSRRVELYKLRSVIEYSTGTDISFNMTYDAIEFESLYSVPVYMPNAPLTHETGELVEEFAFEFTELKTAFNVVNYAIPKKDVRLCLNDACYKKIKNKFCLLGSDGHRLALAPIELNCETSFHLPKWSAFIFTTKEHHDAKMTIYESRLKIETNEFTLSFYHKPENYPDFSRVYDEKYTEHTVNKKDLLKELTLISKMCKGKNVGAQFSIANQLLKLNTDVVNLAVNVEGYQDNTCGLDISFALAAIKACTGNKIGIRMHRERLVIFTDGNTEHLVMVCKLYAGE